MKTLLCCALLVLAGCHDCRVEPPDEPRAKYHETTVNRNGTSAARIGVLVYRGKEHVILRYWDNTVVKVGEYPVDPEATK